jgi:hypothetical protein
VRSIVQGAHPVNREKCGSVSVSLTDLWGPPLFIPPLFFLPRPRHFVFSVRRRDLTLATTAHCHSLLDYATSDHCPLLAVAPLLVVPMQTSPSTAAGRGRLTSHARSSSHPWNCHGHWHPCRSTLPSAYGVLGSPCAPLACLLFSPGRFHSA